jgi:hypothetical protein
VSGHFAGWRRATSPNLRRHELGRMNKLEAAYEAQVLMPLRLAGKVISLGFECLRLRLADKTTYTPDFFVQAADLVLELHEVKPWSGKLDGPFWEEDARLKWKLAAEEYPCFRVFAVTLAPDGWRAESAFREDRDAALHYGRALRGPSDDEVDGLGRAAGAGRRRNPTYRTDV